MRRITRLAPFIACLLSIGLGAWGCASKLKTSPNNGGGTPGGSTAPAITTQPADASVTVGASPICLSEKTDLFDGSIAFEQSGITAQDCA